MANVPDLIVSVSGIRGIIGGSLTPEIATRFAQAFGQYCHRGVVLVGRDSRPSGRMLRHAVIAGLQASGCHVEDVGIVPTPTCGVLVQSRKAAGAIQITASHNPSPWNGLKMFGPDGAVLAASEGHLIEQAFRANQLAGVAWDAIGNEVELRGMDEEHLQRVLPLVDRDLIRRRHFRVLLDTNGGAGGPLAVALLSELGCDVIPVGTEPDGHFAHEPEPTPAHLTELAPRVAAENADVGFVLDPDADRLALIDADGVCLSEELTLALAIQSRLDRDHGLNPCPIVVNMSTSRVIEDIAHQSGRVLYRTAVGEANVVAGIRHFQSIIGGEGNGGVIDPRIGWVRDPFIGMAMILELMARRGLTLRACVDQLPVYTMRKLKMDLPLQRWPEVSARLVTRFSGVTLDRTDGVRFDWKHQWLHIRPSNTEPIVRIIAEAPTDAEVNALCEQAQAEFIA